MEMLILIFAYFFLLKVFLKKFIQTDTLYLQWFKYNFIIRSDVTKKGSPSPSFFIFFTHLDKTQQITSSSHVPILFTKVATFIVHSENSVLAHPNSHLSFANFLLHTLVEFRYPNPKPKGVFCIVFFLFLN